MNKEPAEESIIQDLLARIRGIIWHPRLRGPLVEDTPNWNMLASSFYAVEDTEMAIEAFEAMSDPGETGLHYLIIYGILQCLYVQQDAVEAMVRAFEPNAQRRYKIEDEPEANEVRQIRNCAVGHPTKSGDVKSTKSPGIQMSYVLVSPDMKGFTLQTSHAKGASEFCPVSIAKLIEINRRVVERVLRKIMAKLEAAEIEQIGRAHV